MFKLVFLIIATHFDVQPLDCEYRCEVFQNLFSHHL